MTNIGHAAIGIKRDWVASMLHPTIRKAIRYPVVKRWSLDIMFVGTTPTMLPATFSMPLAPNIGNCCLPFIVASVRGYLLLLLQANFKGKPYVTIYT
jgi:hypothetical protein